MTVTNDIVPEADMHLLRGYCVAIKKLNTIMLRRTILLYAFTQEQCDINFVIVACKKLTEDCLSLFKECAREIDRYIIISGPSANVGWPPYIFDMVDVQLLVKRYLNMLKCSTRLYSGLVCA